MYDIETRSLPNGLILDLAGPLGQEAGDAVVQLVQGLDAPPQRLVLNFTGTGPIVTAGLGGVLWAVRFVHRAGGQVTAYGLTDHFRKVFHVMGLTQYIRLCPDEESARS